MTLVQHLMNQVHGGNMVSYLKMISMKQNGWNISV